MKVLSFPICDMNNVFTETADLAFLSSCYSSKNDSQGEKFIKVQEKNQTKPDSGPRDFLGSCILGVRLVYIRIRVRVSIGGRGRGSFGGVHLGLGLGFRLGLGPRTQIDLKNKSK